LHNTERLTQPWKTGLEVDYDTNVKQLKIGTGFFKRVLAKFGVVKKEVVSSDSKQYMPHPDFNQERFFLHLLKECMDLGVIDADYLNQQISESNLRKDIFEQLEKVS